MSPDHFLPVAVEIRGEVYPSQSAAARALGVSQATVCHALDRGDIDRVGLRGRLLQPIALGGVQYRSTRQAAKALGMSNSQLQRRVRRGDIPGLEVVK